jgi:hypothetical protein
MAESTEQRTVAELVTDLSEEVLESIEAGHRSTAEAVRKFVETFDAAIPNLVSPSLRKTILDAALELAEQLVTTQVQFLRSVIRSASETLKEGTAKPADEGEAKPAAD